MADSVESSDGSFQMEIPAPAGSSTSITGSRDCASSATTSMAAAVHMPSDIMRTPSSMKLKPRPRITPRSAGLGIHPAILRASPVAPSTSQITAVTSPDAASIAGVTTTPAEDTAAAAPTAFIGCTGKGVRYQSPVAIIAPPKPSSSPTGSTLTMAR